MNLSVHKSHQGHSNVVIERLYRACDAIIDSPGKRDVGFETFRAYCLKLCTKLDNKLNPFKGSLDGFKSLGTSLLVILVQNRKAVQL